MKPRVYVETTVISYLTARPARDVVVAGHQQSTRDWWEIASDRFELVVSDLVHVAIAAANGVEYLVTWNFRHIANAVARPLIESCCRQAGFAPPTICTPEELMEETHNEG